MAERLAPEAVDLESLVELTSTSGSLGKALDAFHGSMFAAEMRQVSESLSENLHCMEGHVRSALEDANDLEDAAALL